jgi:hypothetical protein
MGSSLMIDLLTVVVEAVTVEVVDTEAVVVEVTVRQLIVPVEDNLISRPTIPA